MAFADWFGQIGVMGSAINPLALVVIVGPQASGKSTVARALSAELRKRDETATL